MSTYDRFTTANYHGLRDGERSNAGYSIPPRVCYCDYTYKDSEGKEMRCGKAFKSTSYNAHTCEAHRLDANRQRSREYNRRRATK